MATDGAATSATGTAPVFSSTSYSFGSGDVGAKLFIAGGTNWIRGWYPIVSVSGGAATLDATAGHATLLLSPLPSGYLLNSSAGCASTGSPTGATWTIDYSQQNSAQVTFDGSSVTAVTSGVTNTITITGHTVSEADVGNGLQITGGTNYIAGFYTIVSVNIGSPNAWVLDRNVTSGAGVAMTGSMGGALATISAAKATAQAGNWIYVSGTYTVTSVLDFAFQAGGLARSSAIIGYGTHRGDAVAATWTTATNSINLLDVSNAFVAVFANIAFTNTAGTVGSGSTGNAVVALSANAWALTFTNCSFSGFNFHVNFNWQTLFTCYYFTFDQCVFGTSVSHAVETTAIGSFLGCKFMSPGGNGVEIVQATNAAAGMGLIAFIGNGFYGCAKAVNSENNQGAGGLNPGFLFVGNTVHSCTSDGLTVVAVNGTFPPVIRNNIIWNTGGYGVNNPNSYSLGVIPYNNAYGSNTSGARNNFPASPGDVALTADPCVSASTGNFNLNATAGGGAACTGTGWQSDIL
jgi:hypothetical protein